MTETAIRVRGLRKIYGSLAAVDGLDLDIQHGELFALLGPNGAGKSTTVEILEGFRRRTAGEVSVLGVDPARGSRQWRGRLGMMLQSESPPSLLTARESLELARGLYTAPRGVEETLDAVGLAEKADARPQTLSGGQRRRLDVALAIIGRPALLFLDEPTTGFDPEARRQFWRLIEGLKEDGTTILLTTHYLDEADYLADRIGIIARGSLIALDTPAGLRARADHVTVRWTENDTAQVTTTREPTAVLRALLARTAGEIPGLEVARPTLEDVYLTMIGEADAPAGPDGGSQS